MGSISGLGFWLSSRGKSGSGLTFLHFPLLFHLMILVKCNYWIIVLEIESSVTDNHTFGLLMRLYIAYYPYFLIQNYLVIQI